jgi:predicted nucleotidyltransferase
MIHPAINIPGQAIANLCRRNEIKELALFGSATREDFRPDASDLDLLVEFQADASIDLFGFLSLQQELERLFQRKVDLVSKRGLSRHIREEVLSSREVLYAQ